MRPAEPVGGRKRRQMQPGNLEARLGNVALNDAAPQPTAEPPASAPQPAAPKTKKKCVSLVAAAATAVSAVAAAVAQQ